MLYKPGMKLLEGKRMQWQLKSSSANYANPVIPDEQTEAELVLLQIPANIPLFSGVTQAWFKLVQAQFSS